MTTSLTTVIAALEARDCRPRGSDERGYMSLCPVHEDRNPSLKVDYRRERVLLKCYAGCDSGTVVSALGLAWSDLYDQDSSAPRRPLSTHVLVRSDSPPELGRTHDLFEDW